MLGVIYLLLDVAPPEVLDNYGEMVRRLHSLYGAQCWFIICNAYVRMRSEHFERLRGQAGRDHDIAVETQARSTYSIDKPWGSVFSMALADTGRTSWEENVHRPAMLYTDPHCQPGRERRYDAAGFGRRARPIATTGAQTWSRRP